MRVSGEFQTSCLSEGSQMLCFSEGSATPHEGPWQPFPIPYSSELPPPRPPLPLFYIIPHNSQLYWLSCPLCHRNISPSQIPHQKSRAYTLIRSLQCRSPSIPNLVSSSCIHSRCCKMRWKDMFWNIYNITLFLDDLLDSDLTHAVLFGWFSQQWHGHGNGTVPQVMTVQVYPETHLPPWGCQIETCLMKPSCLPSSSYLRWSLSVNLHW